MESNWWTLTTGKLSCIRGPYWLLVSQAIYEALYINIKSSVNNIPLRFEIDKNWWPLEVPFNISYCSGHHETRVCDLVDVTQPTTFADDVSLPRVTLAIFVLVKLFASMDKFGTTPINWTTVRTHAGYLGHVCSALHLQAYACDKESTWLRVSGKCMRKIRSHNFESCDPARYYTW